MTDAVVQVEAQQPSLHIHMPGALATGATHAKGQQHPIKLYLVVWGWLFVLSTGSYLVDYFGLHGYLRWSLILLFMVLKAGLIVAVFMHMAWERLALAYAILAIYEAPDDAVAARFNLQLGMLGNIRTRTLKAFPEAAYREIISSLG